MTTRKIPINQARPKQRLYLNRSGLETGGEWLRILAVKPEPFGFRLILEGNQWLHVDEGEMITVI